MAARLYVDPHYRRQGGARLLIDTIKQSAATAGFSTLYLCTDLVSFYEKFGFELMGTGYHPWGEESMIYRYPLQK